MVTKTYTLLLTSSCNFNCSFCATRKLNIEAQEHVSDELKQYLISNKVKNLVITGGEPLSAPVSYIEEILDIMDNVNCGNDYEVNILSNLVLWKRDPEKYDKIFSNKHVEVDTSFQYGGERKDDEEYTENRFLDIFNEFYNRYHSRLIFNYVVNKNNEDYILKACELAKRLKTKVSLSPQLPVGASKELYLQPDIFEVCAKVIEAGYKDQLVDIDWINSNQCFFGINEKCDVGGNTLYIDKNGKIVERHCYPMMLLDSPIEITNDVLFHKCYACRLKDICNNCSVLRHFTEQHKDEHCKKMKENMKRFIELGLIKC